jgi:hypothetical protein
MPGRPDAADLIRWSSRQLGHNPCSSRHVAQIVFMQSRQTATDGTAL